MLSFSDKVKLYNEDPLTTSRGGFTFDVFGILCLVEHVTDVEKDYYCCLIPKCSIHSRIEENERFTFS